MNRSELARVFAERVETTPRIARETIDSLVDLITETVAKGEDVAISGFAKFRRVDRAARMGRNPATGEPVKIKAKRVAKITPLKAFKDAVVSGRTPSKAPAKKAVAKKAPAKKAVAKKAPARKAVAKKAPARKAPAKKAVARKAPARKAPAKKTAAKRR